MAKTNTTRTRVPIDGGYYDIHTVIASTSSAISDTSFNTETGVIIVPNNANDLPLTFNSPITVTGNKNVVPFFIKNYRKDANHYSVGIHFRDNTTFSNVSIISAGPLNSPLDKLHTWRNVFVKLLPNRANNSTLLRLNNGTLDIDGLVVEGGSCALDNSKITKLDNYSPRNMAEGLLLVTGTAWKQFTGFNPISCTKDAGFIGGGSKYVFYGYPTKAPTGGVHFNHPHVTGLSALSVRKELNITLKNKDTKALISGATSKFSGVRQNASLYTESSWLDHLGNKINTPINYTATSNAKGELLFDLLLAFLGIAANDSVGANSPSRPVLYLSHATDFNYFFNIPIRVYGFKESLAKYDLTGLAKRINVEVELEVETGVVNSNSGQVYSYTSLETLSKLHDFWHSFYTTNFDYSNVIVGNGTELVIASGWNLVINSSATAVFFADKTNKTITIKASTFSKGSKYTSLKLLGGDVTFLGTPLNNMNITAANVRVDKVADITNTTITGNLVYNTATSSNLNITNSTISLIKNDGTGKINLTFTGTISDFSDPQIIASASLSIAHNPNTSFYLYAGATASSLSLVTTGFIIPTSQGEYSVTAGTKRLTIPLNHFYKLLVKTKGFKPEYFTGQATTSKSIILKNELLAGFNASVDVSAEVTLFRQTGVIVFDKTGSTTKMIVDFSVLPKGKDLNNVQMAGLLDALQQDDDFAKTVFETGDINFVRQSADGKIFEVNPDHIEFKAPTSNRKFSFYIHTKGGTRTADDITPAEATKGTQIILINLNKSPNDAKLTDVGLQEVVAGIWNKDVSNASTGAGKYLKEAKEQSTISANNTQKD